jgi:phage terminase large subunit GpA-like protein
MIVNISTKKMDALISKLKNPKEPILAAAADVLAHVVKSWGAAKSPNNSPLDKLSKGYERAKIKSGRNGIPDMSYTGQLQQSMNVSAVSNYKAIITASKSGRTGSSKTNLDILGYNVDKRPNLVLLSNSIKKKAAAKFKEKLFKGN